MRTVDGCRTLAAVGMAVLLADAPAVLARDSVRNFPAPGTCPIHLGWPIDGGGNPIPTAPPRVRPELVFVAQGSEAALTFSACDDRNHYDRPNGTDVRARLDLTLDDVAVVRKDVYDANQVALATSCYAGSDDTVVRSVFNASAFTAGTPQMPFRDTFEGSAQGWSLGTAAIGFFSPDGADANRNPSGRRLAMARQTRPAADDVEGFQDLQFTLNGLWFQDTTQGHSGTQSFTVSDSASSTDFTLQTRFVQFVAAGDELSFWHRFQTQASFDGGVLEYSTDGFTFFDVRAGNGAGIPANPGRFVQNGYNGTLGGNNPLAGRAAWTGNSGGYQLVRLNLADFVGWPVTWQWRFTTNSSTAGVGWSLDDLVVAMPGASCSTARVQVHNLQAGTAYVVDFKWDAQGFSAGEQILSTLIDTAPPAEIP